MWHEQSAQKMGVHTKLRTGVVGIGPEKMYNVHLLSPKKQYSVTGVLALVNPGPLRLGGCLMS